MRKALMMDFPLDEYEVRIKNLQNKMTEAKVSGVLLTQEENLRYFSGARSTAWKSKFAPVFALIVTEDGRMRLICNVSELAVCEHTSCVSPEDIRCFGVSGKGLPVSIHEAIAEAFRELRIDKARVGFESGMVARIGFNFEEYLLLRSELGDCCFVPFAEKIWELRSIKSEREIDIYRQVCDMSGKCYQKAFDSVVLDKTTEKEVFHIFAEEAFRLGADSMPPLIVAFGQGRYTQANCPPSDKVITSKKHEFLFIDTGPALKGYITDTIRMAVVDSMSPRQKELRQMADEALDFCLDMIKDGVNCSEVSAKMDAMIDAKGFGPWNQTRGWTGHGIGLDIHEPPTLSCDCDMTIRSGMILSVEPLMMDEVNGIISTELNVLVTDTGNINLTPWLREMVIL